MIEEAITQHLGLLFEITYVDYHMWVTFESLYREYTRHLKRKGIEPMEEGTLARVMIDYGFDYDYDRLPAGFGTWYGIGLRSSRTDPNPLADVENCFYGGGTLIDTKTNLMSSGPHWFDLFLKGNVVGAKDVAIRDADLYEAMRKYCFSRGYKPLTREEYHTMMKQRGAQQRPLVRQIMMWGLQWKEDAPYRPSGPKVRSTTAK